MHSPKQLEAEVQRLQSENKELELSLERTTKQFRNDSEALMADYQRSIERLHDAKADRDKYKNQYETLLAQRERTEHMGSQVSMQTIIMCMHELGGFPPAYELIGCMFTYHRVGRLHVYM